MWVLVTSKGQRVALRELPAVLGSTREADVVVPHESVAARHARFRDGADGSLYVDAIDGAHLEVGGWQVAQAGLRAGDGLVVGRIAFTVEGQGTADGGTEPAERAAPAAAGQPARARRASTTPGLSPAPAEQSLRPTPTLVPREQGHSPTPAARPARAADDLRLRGRGLLVSRKPAREGWVHTDLSSLSTGSKIVVLLGLAALAAGLWWAIQWAVARAL